MRLTQDVLAALKDLLGILPLKYVIAHVQHHSSTPKPEDALNALMKSQSGTDTLVLLALLELTTMLIQRHALSVPKDLFTMLEREPALLHDYYPTGFLLFYHKYEVIRQHL